MLVYIYTYIHTYIYTYIVKCHIWSLAFYGTETRSHQKVDQKYLEDFGM